jgi:aspartyl-tRNA(Asn)/glutamyl-tRNA(Gln) amidotransferase subunit A
MTWTVRDAADVLAVLVGQDPRDPTTVEYRGPRFASRLDHGVGGLRVGYARSLFIDAGGVHPELERALDIAVEQLARRGAAVDEVDTPPFELFNACGRIIMTAEAFAIHEQRLIDEPQKFARYTFQRLAPGALITGGDLVRAQQLRRHLTSVFNDQVLAAHDCVVSACTFGPAARIDSFPEHWPPPRDAVGTFTIPFNVTGNPAVSVPIGRSRDGLPLAMQIVGRPFDEAIVLGVAAEVEALLAERSVRPDIDDWVARPRPLENRTSDTTRQEHS